MAQASLPLPHTSQPANVQPGANGKASRPARVPREPHAEADRLAGLLLGYVVQNNPVGKLARKSPLEHTETRHRWALEIDKFHGVSHIEWEEIDSMIHWIQGRFKWRPKILEARNLAHFWDRMAAEKDPGGKTKTNVTVGQVRATGPEDYDATVTWGNKPKQEQTDE